MFGPKRLIAASLRHYWRTHLAVAAAVAVTTAVLTGALLVGDSMRGSLRALAIERLGRIDRVLLTDHFFRAELAAQLRRGDGQDNDEAMPAQAAILLPVAIDHGDSDRPARANDVQLLGIQPGFWRLEAQNRRANPAAKGRPINNWPIWARRGQGWQGRRSRHIANTSMQPDAASRRRSPPKSVSYLSVGPKWELPAAGQVVLNRAAAERLGARVGDELLLRLPVGSTIPEETPLGRREGGVRSVRVELIGIVPDRGPGRFGLQPSQRRTLNAYVDRDWLAKQLDQPGRANAILLAGADADRPMPDDLAQRITEHFAPALTDYGLRLERTPRGYFNLTSGRLLIDPRMDRAVTRRLQNNPPPSPPTAPVGTGTRRPHPSPLPEGEGTQIQPVLTYLANTIAAGSRAIPYSTVTAIDFTDEPPLGPWRSVQGERIPALQSGEIVLNRWAAEELDAELGDRVRLDYFAPATLEGDPAEQSATFRLIAIAAMEGAAVDRNLVPRVPGVTDELTMADWDPPFPFDAGRIRDADERYWEQYGPTPKAFVSLADGRRLWGSRFGSTTSLRIVAAEATGRDQLAETITPAPEAIGWTFQPVKRQALEAAAGTTPFGVLFLSFSMFLIASAVMLTAMLFRLGVTTRAAELGLLATVGLPRRTIVRLLLGESLPVAVAGGLLGTIAGAGYAALMLLGLRTWWQAAVAMPLLRLHVTSTSLAIGALAGVITGAVTIAVTLWQASGIAPRRLLAGLMRGASRGEGRGARSERLNWSLWVGWTALGVAAVTVLITGRLDERFRIAAFFAAATLTLIGGVMLVRSWLAGGWGGGRFSLATLAARGAAREPGRATLSVALVAAACFLIVAVSAFHIDTQSATGPPPLDSGTGGFTLYAESTQPIFHDLGTEAGQRKLGFTDEERRLLGKCTVIPLRAKPGDQASCLNLYQAQRPRLVGVGERLVEHDGFAWADVPRGADNPWRLLSKNAGQAPPLNAALPMIVDHNVAIYSLHLYGGVGEQFPIRAAGGEHVDLEIVATLAGSVFQGDLLVSEADLMQMFPAVSGYRVFLIDSPVDQTDRVRAVLEDVLGPYGLAAERTERRLADFLAVQNTYLATFRALGGLGLLLGTVGLAVVQLRSVIERRAELALLRAVGFRRRRLGALVLLETAVLLAAGLIVGTLAALIAVLPHLLTQQAHVPWLPLTGTLVLVFAVGLIASGLAVRAAVRVPLLATLRRERV